MWRDRWSFRTAKTHTDIRATEQCLGDAVGIRSGVGRLLPSLCSSKNLVQAFLPLLDQPLGGRDDFFGQEFEQVVLIGEADGLQNTLVYQEVSKHRPVFTFLLKNRDKGDLNRSTVAVISWGTDGPLSSTITKRARPTIVLMVSVYVFDCGRGKSNNRDPPFSGLRSHAATACKRAVHPLQTDLE